jgi:protease-4
VAQNVDGLVDGRIYSGRQALAHKLVDEIGGEAEAIRWLETNRGVAKDLKVVNWKPTPESTWGSLTGEASLAVGKLVAATLGNLAQLASVTPGLGGVGLDGLVSVWQPSEN